MAKAGYLAGHIEQEILDYRVASASAGLPVARHHPGSQRVTPSSSDPKTDEVLASQASRPAGHSGQ
jgi:hypothetical protein